MKITLMLSTLFAVSRLIAADIPAAPVQIAASVLAAPEEDAVNLILYRMHRLRVFQRGVR